MVFYDGFRPQIHPPITTLHTKLTTTVQLNGFFKEVYSINGSPLGRSYGYTENVRYSPSSPGVSSLTSLNSVAGSGKSVLWFVLPQLFQRL
jgi:hypothetical protein